MSDEDLEVAQWHQKEQEESRLLDEVRERTKHFRRDCDQFHAEFDRITKEIFNAKS
jgi:hypothetical protein